MRTLDMVNREFDRLTIRTLKLRMRMLEEASTSISMSTVVSLNGC
jgi:hypothetical protein